MTSRSASDGTPSLPSSLDPASEPALDHGLRSRLNRLPRRFRTISKGLRFQLTVRVLAVLVPTFLISEAIVSHLATTQILKVTKSRMRSESELLSFALSKWGSANRRMLAALANDQSLQERNVPQINDLFRSLESLYPHREWRYWTADAQPRLLAYTGKINAEGRKRAELNILNRDYFQSALKGIPSYGVVKSYANNQVCLMIAQPVYKDSQQTLPLPQANDGLSSPGSPGYSAVATAPNQKPTAVILSCILLQKLAGDTGFKQVLKTLDLSTKLSEDDQFNHRRTIRSVLLLASRQGHILYPTADKLKTQAIPTIADFQNGYWQPLFLQIRQAAGGKEFFSRVKVGKDYYFLMVNQADEAWSTILIVNEEVVFANLKRLRFSLELTALASLVLACLAIQWGCSRITAPIVRAGDALEAISAGDFDTHIVHQRDDEIGELLDNINMTSRQLKNYLANETSHAITRKQLETAHDIQQDFLVSEMPRTDKLQMAPVFLPAYEIGADWYDALTVNGIVYIVVADVCDKGIPSALYMSVFRSLIRYGLLNASDAIGGPGERLQSVITLANDYMAMNHGDSTMFATTFLGAIDPENRRLYYISGGHEPTLVSRSESNQWLQPTGPAVGIFAGATYAFGTVELQPNDYILAYSDGLVDARSPAGEGWGVKSLEAFMNQRRGGSASAEEVLKQLLEVVGEHCADAERFDDLTVMVLHLVG